MKFLLLTTLWVFLSPVLLFAQLKEEVKHLTKEVLVDPTSYAPATLLFVSAKLDWLSSQPHFHRGSYELNRQYTQPGTYLTAEKGGIPISYKAGSKLINLTVLKQARNNLLLNLGVRTGEHLLVKRFPNQKKVWKTLSFGARLSVALGQSYILSFNHFTQWQKNKKTYRAHSWPPPL